MTVKFDAAFLDKKMAEHKRWQHDVLNEMVREAIAGVAEEVHANPTFGQRTKAPVLPFPEPAAVEVGKGQQKFVRAL